MKNFVVWLYPPGNPLLRDSGASTRTYGLIREILKSSNVILLVPSETRGYQKTSKHPRIEVRTFNPYRIGGVDVGIYLMGFNPSYWINLINIIKTTPVTEMIGSLIVSALPLVLAKVLLKKRVIYDSHNVEKERVLEGSLTEIENRFKFILKFRWYLHEYLAVKTADEIISISHDDKRKLVELYRVPPEKIHVRPPRINYCDKAEKEFPKRSGIPMAVFHGTYWYLPNREALRLIMDYLAERLRYVQFVVFGSHTPKISKGNFRSLGFVDDVFKFLSSCDVAIVPLRRGAGVKLKMLDYMAIGLPIVTTKKGAEGLDLVNGKHALIVDDVDEGFIRAVKQLIENPKLRRKLGHNTKKLAMKKYRVTWNGG